MPRAGAAGATGSNSQGWRWVFVEDAARKRRSPTSPGQRPGLPRRAGAQVATPTATPAASGWGESAIRRLSRRTQPQAPVLIPAERPGRRSRRWVACRLGPPLFPAVWALPGAALRGLGSCWTTLHLLDNGGTGWPMLGIPLRRNTAKAGCDRLHTRHRLPAGQAAAGRSVTHWSGW